MKTLFTGIGVEFCNLKELSKGLEIGRVTLRKYIKEGRLKAKKVGRGYLVTREAVQEFLSVTEKAESAPVNTEGIL